MLSEPGICWVWLKDEKYDVKFEHIVLWKDPLKSDIRWCVGIGLGFAAKEKY